MPTSRLAGKAFTYVLLIVGAAIVSIPFLWTVSTALKAPAQVYAVPVEWIPKPIMWENFAQAWTVLPFFRFLRNTVFVTLMCLVGQLFSASLVAYGFARFDFRGRTALFYLLLGTMMLPGQVTMIPTFLIWREFRLVDTFAPLIVPAYFGGGAFTIFLLRQFFMTIPRDLDEAAMIDGCSYFGIWWRIILPLSKPALTTVVIFSFISHWDEFMGPLIYLHTMDKYTVSIGLRMFQDMYGGQLELLMAASLIHITPCIILFIAAQRYFIKGIVMSGIKA
ncbi:MAG: carbohydrate ABC transporter permease [Armatimonadetes bacterium]|nr:carbohydrate ABC transporter permease [Armatimonadota bacterium]